jgi:hypothetical protein
MTVYTPGPELVAAAWLGTLNLPLVGEISGNRLPVNKWRGVVFLQVSSMAGRTDPYDSVRNSYVQVDAWGAPGKLGETNSIAEEIYNATFFSGSYGHLPIKVGNTARRPVNLSGVTVFSAPRALRDEKDGLARTTMILAMVYNIENLSRS